MSEVIRLEHCTSTNDEAGKRISVLDNLSAIITRGQSSGRGQGDHSWHSAPGMNLTFSYVLKPAGLKAADSILLTCITTLSLLNYLRSRGVEAGIKWPNDIWVSGRKICGILIENVLEGEMVKSSIIGIGLNVNQCDWPEDLPNPVSLKELTGKTYDIDAEFAALYEEIRLHEELLSSAEGRFRLQEEFGKYVFRLAEEP